MTITTTTTTSRENGAAGSAGAAESAEAAQAADAAVRTALATAGITPTEEEIEALVAGFPRFRAMADLLHAVPAARYESPGLHFNPTPVFAEWG